MIFITFNEESSVPVAEAYSTSVTKTGSKCWASRLLAKGYFGPYKDTIKDFILRDQA